MKKTSVYILDDHQLIRDGLALLISQSEDFCIAGSSSNCADALVDISRQNPNIIIIDITLKDANGIEFIKAVSPQFPDIKYIVLSMHDENSYAERAVKAGASGYVMKQEVSDKIVSALKAVRDGEIFLSDTMKSKILSRYVSGRFGAKQLSPETSLSDREFEIFSMIADGKGSRRIAEELGISIKTVDAHKEHIRVKLEIQSGNQLVVEAVTWKVKKLDVDEW